MLPARETVIWLQITLVSAHMTGRCVVWWLLLPAGPVTANFWVKNEGEATVNVDSVALHISADVDLALFTTNAVIYPPLGGAAAAAAKKVPRKPRIVRAPSRNRNLRSAPALPLVLNDNASYPILLAPGQYLVYRVQFVIRQDSLDVNEAISVTPLVVATGPQKLNTLTGNQLAADTWTIRASQSHHMEVTVDPLVVKAVPQAGEL